MSRLEEIEARHERWRVRQPDDSWTLSSDCAYCGQVWPCDANRLLAVARAAREYILCLRQLVYTRDSAVFERAFRQADGLGERYAVAVESLQKGEGDG